MNKSEVIKLVLKVAIGFILKSLANSGKPRV